MSYISDAERERARWMTLAELIAHVTKHYRDRPADQQVRNALGDGKLITKWEDATADQRRRRLPTDPPPMSSADGLSWEPTVPDWPPRKGGFWQQARIEGDKVFDPETGRARTLLIFKNSVFRFWPEPAVENGSTVVSITRAKGGRPTERNEIYRALDALVQEHGEHIICNMPQEQLAEMVAEKCGAQLDESPGWDTQTVVRHIRAWKKERQNPG